MYCMLNSVKELVSQLKGAEKAQAKSISCSNLKIFIEGSSTEAKHFSSENIVKESRQAANSLCFSLQTGTRECGT